ncbi:helicase HerA-like domain-containing protein [Aquihabitans sp. McL0605]|uniref:helicase HerA-like domain-containing protein n=1 Tax=Aquihabitans sp. McL0605 TaxID=3415671 RepID=UPI003CF8054C
MTPTDQPTEAFGTRIAAGYASTGATVDIGRAVLDGTSYPEAVVQIPTAMCNRHGLIAGATGTGKTVTLQLLAEQLSAQGVPVFTADIKGDLTGLAEPAQPGDKIQARIDELKLTYTPTGTPVQFWALGGQGPGVPVRASLGSFGPQLLSKVLGANETQSSSLALVFYYADQKGLPLLDLVDLVDLLKYLTGDEGKAELKSIGGLSSATAGVLLRKLVELQQQDAELFFGEPEVSIDHLIRLAPDGRGVVNCLELAAVQDRPKLFSTFMMWLLAHLFETLPEAGDLDKPKLVFFFDEAHLLFDGAPKEFIDQVAQTVRLIRSKGVGVFFITQLPDDVPDVVLAQLGNRVQHGLRAYTPRDAKALKAAVSTYPKTSDYDLEEALTQLGIGEAIVTTLSDNGAPTPVAWTRVRPPESKIGAIDPAQVATMAQASDLWATYATELDRPSAREMLAQRMGVAPAAPTAPAPAGPSDPAAVRPDLPPPPGAPSPGDLVKDSGIDPGDFDVRVPDAPTKPKAAPKEPKAKAKKDDGNAVTDFLKSREGRATVNNVVRGVFDLIKQK